MWLSRLGTLSITAIQGALAADALENHSLVPVESKCREVVVQFEPQTPITAFELRYGIVRLPFPPTQFSTVTPDAGQEA